jgi:ATP-dependent Clp protease ATP-binding subunit ClpC
MVLSPEGTEAEVRALQAELENIGATFASPEWDELKATLADRMIPADFWSRPDRFETLSRIALMDRVKAAASTAEALKARLARGTERAGRSSRELVARLALQLHLVNEGMRDVFDAAPIEAALRVEPAFERAGDEPAARRWCSQLLDMYRGWATNRHMQLVELGRERARELPVLVFTGFGAHRQLCREIGLHVLELQESDSGSDRLSARVRVVAAPVGDLPPQRLLSELNSAFERAGTAPGITRRYRENPSPLVRDIGGSWRTGRLDAVLRGDFDLIAANEAAE